MFHSSRARLTGGTVFIITTLAAAMSAHAAAVVRHFPITAETSLDIDGNPGVIGLPVGEIDNVLSELSDFNLRSPAGAAPVFVEGRLGGDDLALFFGRILQDPTMPAGAVTPPTQLTGLKFCGFCKESTDISDVMLEASDGETSSTFTRAMQLWVKPDPAGLGHDQLIVGSYAGQPGGIGITAGGNWAHLAISLRGEGGFIGRLVFIDTGVPVEFGVWAHVGLATFVNSDRMFLNGRTLTAESGLGLSTLSPAIIGAASDGIDSPFIGAVDDIKFMIPSVVVGGFDPRLDLDYFADMVFSGITGDINQDGVVSQNDYQIWAQNAGFDNGLAFGDAATLLLGDANENGIIDLTDFALIKHAAAAQGNLVIPEPGTLILLVVGSLALHARPRAMESGDP